MRAIFGRRQATNIFTMPHGGCRCRCCCFISRLATKRASGALVPASPVRASAGSQLSGGSGSGCGTPAAGAAAAADSPNAHLRSVLKHTPGIKRASLSGTSLGAAPVAAPSPVPPLHSGREGAILDVRISSSAAGPAGANGGGGAGTSGDAAAGPRLEFLVRWSGSATVSHDAVVAATAGAAGAAAAAAAAGVWPPAPAARPALVEWVPTEGVPSKAVLKRFMGGSPRWVRRSKANAQTLALAACLLVLRSGIYGGSHAMRWPNV